MFKLKTAMSGVSSLKTIAVNIAALPKFKRIRSAFPKISKPAATTEHAAPKIEKLLTKQKEEDTKKKEKEKPALTCEQEGTCVGSGPMEQSSQIDECWDQPCIVIIGAGMAGLSAGQRLLNAGLRNFTILEATERPGGRVLSCWLGDTVVEMGAEEIWGSQFINPVFALACEEGLLSCRQNNSPFPCPKRNLYFTSDGRAVESSGVEQMVVNRVTQQAKEMYRCCAPGGKTHVGNLQHYLGIRLQQELLEFPKPMRYDAERIMFGHTNSIRSRLGADLTQVSVKHFGSYEDPPGGNMRVPLGFIGVLAPLLRCIPKGNIHYEKPVTSVKWANEEQEGERRVSVTTSDGNVYPADYCIVALPMGVLKRKVDEMFCPELPSEKRDAIAGIGVGHQCKVFLEYGRPWWSGRDNSLLLAWSQEELADRSEWTKAVGSVKSLPGSSHTLGFSVGGPEAKFLESCAEEEIAIEFTRLLRKFLADSTLPYPCNVLRTSWSTDKFFQGATTFMNLGSSVGHMKDLLGNPAEMQPGNDPPAVLFAGESVALGAYGSVHGARRTGILQADKIVELTKRFGGPPPSKLPPPDQ